MILEEGNYVIVILGGELCHYDFRGGEGEEGNNFLEKEKGCGEGVGREEEGGGITYISDVREVDYVT